ncbi:MAG: MMPL family transporter, partial [Gammaproteobacteria bacterium]
MNSTLESCGRILEALAAWAIRFRLLVLVAALLLSAVGLRYAVANLGINTDTANMIARDLPWRESFDTYRNAFPVRDRNLVVVVESADGYVAEGLAQHLAARMREEPGVFPSVFLAGDGDFFERNGLLYLPVAELERLSDRLIAAQPLLGQLIARPNGAGVLDVLSRALETGSGVRADEASEALQTAVAGVFESLDDTAVQPLDWGSLLETREPPQNRQLILVRPSLDFSRARPAREAIDRLREFIAEADSEADVPVSIRLTGTIAMEHEELDSVVSSASLAGMLALVMVVIVLYWALRSVRLVAVAVIVLLVGLIGTASLAAILVGRLNLLSVAFAVLYIGLGVDFILHICLRVRELLAEGADVRTAITGTMRSIGTSLVICTLTTAAGFYAFVPSRLFEGISELGLISGTGMFVSFFVSVTVLPAMLASFYRRNHRLTNTHVGLLLTSFALRRARIVVAVSVAVVLAAAVSLPRVYFDS